jgi:TonB family protein
LRLARETSFVALLLALAAGSLTPPAVAQADVTPPRLAHAPKPEVAAEEATVVLEITIDEAGHVTDATVVQSAGDELDRRALAGARALEFEPARRSGVAVPVRIRFAFAFESAEPPAAQAPAAPPPPEPAPAPPTPPPPVESDEYVATAEVERPPREATRRTLSGPELTTMPGTRGDALRAIEILPGVGRTSINDGRPILRGSSPFESQTFIAGVPVPMLFHFGGVTSVVSSRLLDRVEVYPGNFSARYGRAVGGIVEADIRSPRSDRLHAVVDLNVIDSSALIEAPLGEDTRVALAGRRSNIDFFFANLVPADAYGVVAAPLYWDYQGIVEQRLGKNHELRVFAFGSRDRIRLLFSHPDPSDVNLRGDVGAAIEFHRAQIQLASRFSPELHHELGLTFGRSDITQAFGPLSQQVGMNELFARSEWTAELASDLTLHGGIDLQLQSYDGGYNGPQPTPSEGDPSIYEPSSTHDRVRLTADFTAINPAAYLELAYRPAPRVLVLPGLRADYFSQASTTTLDPRLNVRLGVSKTTTLKGGVGRYSQIGEFWQFLPEIGNPALRPYHALHLGAGVEQKIGPAKLSVEGFYKWIDDRVVGTPGGAAPRFVNDGQGRIYGGELGLEARPDPDTGLHAAYTISRSERRDGNQSWRLFDQDQTHVLALAASRRLGAGWEVGARFRLVSGNPRTAVVGAVYDAGSDSYLPVYGATNGERAPLYHQLDLRVEKAFRVGPGSIAVYLDLLNAYNRQNEEGVAYSYDYSRKQSVTSLPLLPSFGVRGEL